jgi:hypothetical protein
MMKATVYVVYYYFGNDRIHRKSTIVEVAPGQFREINHQIATSGCEIPDTLPKLPLNRLTASGRVPSGARPMISHKPVSLELNSRSTNQMNNLGGSSGPALLFPWFQLYGICKAGTEEVMPCMNAFHFMCLQLKLPRA